MAGQENKNADAEGDISGDNAHPTETKQNSDVNVTEEYNFLDTQLDQLNSALDFLEQKNNDIVERLKELLQSNRDIRQELQNGNTDDMEMDTTSNPTD